MDQQALNQMGLQSQLGQLGDAGRPYRYPPEGHVPGKIHFAITSIMAEVGGVAKSRSNEQQHYKFRGIADLYLACQPVMAKHGVHFVAHRVVADEAQIRETKSGAKMVHVRQRIEFRFYAGDGSFVSCETTGEAMDSGDKASNKAISAAAKYALIVTFAIPEQDPEVDTETASPELAGADPKGKSSVSSSSGSKGTSQTSKGTSSPSSPPDSTATSQISSKASSELSTATGGTRADWLKVFRRGVMALGWTEQEVVGYLVNACQVEKVSKLSDEQLMIAARALEAKVEARAKEEAA